MKEKDRDFVMISMTPELKKELLKEATAKGLKISTYIRTILMKRKQLIND